MASKITAPQLRMLCLLVDGKSHERWRLLFDSGSHNSGYRVLEALCGKGLATNQGGHGDQIWFKITDAGHAAIARAEDR